jgi:hypothetical protein
MAVVPFSAAGERIAPKGRRVKRMSTMKKNIKVFDGQDVRFVRKA